MFIAGFSMNKENIQIGTKIDYPMHGKGEIKTIDNDIVEIWFSNQNMSIKMPYLSFVNNSDITVSTEQIDTGSMLQILATYKPETIEITEKTTKHIVDNINEEDPVSVAKALVKIWHSETSNPTDEIRKTKMEKYILNILSDYMMMHLMSYNQVVTKEQSKEKILNYKVLRK